MPLDPDRFYETVELNWPRYEDGRYVRPGDVVDVERVGRMKVREVACYGGTSFYINGFWCGGLVIKPVEKGAA